MKKLALIKDGIVQNVILVEDDQDQSHWSDFSIREIPDDSFVGPGIQYEAGEFIHPGPTPEPPIVVEPPSLEAILDLLLEKGIITQSQRDAIG